MNKIFFSRNRKIFAEKIKNNSIAIFFSNGLIRNTADIFYPFSVDRNFYYLTGINREDMIYMVTKIDGYLEECLYIPPKDELREKWVIPFMLPQEAAEISGIHNVKFNIDFYQDFAKKINKTHSIENLYLFFYITEFNEYENHYRKFAEKIRNHFPSLKILNSYNIMAELRSHKSQEEIEEVKKAIDLTKEALDYTVARLKPGIFEYEIFAHYQYKLALKNSKPRFLTYVASGINGTILHYDLNKDQVNDNELVLIDAGTDSNLYVSDITRTYPVNGKFNARQKDLYQIVFEAEEIALSLMKAGTTVNEVNESVKKYYAKELKRIKLIKEESDVQKYYFHGIGHNLGLDQRDLDNYNGILVENAIFTVEPGLYIAEEGIGIRIEDNVLITKTGVENLSVNIMRSAEDIENLMK